MPTPNDVRKKHIENKTVNWPPPVLDRVPIETLAKLERMKKE